MRSSNRQAKGLRTNLTQNLRAFVKRKIIFDKISTGALSDLEKVTKQAYSMVSVYGLSDKVGNISFYDSSGRESFSKPYSESTAKLIDDEVSKLVEDCYQETLKLLKKHKNKLTQRFAEDVVQDVEPAAVRHADDDGLRAPCV